MFYLGYQNRLEEMIWADEIDTWVNMPQSKLNYWPACSEAQHAFHPLTADFSPIRMSLTKETDFLPIRMSLSKETDLPPIRMPLTKETDLPPIRMPLKKEIDLVPIGILLTK